MSGVRGEGGPGTARAQVRPGAWRGSGFSWRDSDVPGSRSPWRGGGDSAPTQPRGGARLRGAAGGWAASETLASYLGDPVPPLGVWRATEGWRSQPLAQLFGGERAL